MSKKIIGIGLPLLALFLILYAINSGRQKIFKWVPTYDRHDRNPFGAYVLDRLLEKSWPEAYTHSGQSIEWQLSKETLSDQNLLAVANHFSFEEDETDRVLEYIGEGRKILIAGDSFDSELQQALGFKVKEHPARSEVFFDVVLYNNLEKLTRKRKISLCSPTFRTKQYTYPHLFCENYFDSIPGDARIIAVNDSNQAIAFRYPVGKGECIVCCIPLFFTNYGMLSYSHEFVWGLLSYLQGAPLVRTEYYETGNKESTSPFRYLLSVPALRWALYLTLATLLVLLVFSARRKQRVIPVIKDPENRLLKFIRSIAALYLKKGDNPGILQKKYLLFAEQLQRGYGIDLINKRHDKALLETVVQKTGSSPEDIKYLFDGLELIYSDFPLTDKMLMELVILMDRIVKSEK